MKKLLIPLILSVVVATSVSADQKPTYPAFDAQVETKCQWINGYTRKDGTYVSGHYRGC